MLLELLAKTHVEGAHYKKGDDDPDENKVAHVITRPVPRLRALRSRNPTTMALMTKMIQTAVPVTINPFILDPTVSQLPEAALIKPRARSVKKSLMPERVIRWAYA